MLVPFFADLSAEASDGLGLVTVIAGIAAACYFGVPLLILQNLRLNPRPRSAGYDPQTDPPPAKVETLRRSCVDDLVALGFEPIGDCRVRGFANNSEMFVTIAVDRRDDVVAAVAVGHLNASGQVEIKKTVEFATHFEDGSLLESVGTVDATMIPAAEGMTRHVFLGTRDLATFRRLHGAAVANESAGKRAVLPDYPDISEWMIRDAERAVRGGAEAGWLTPIGERGRYQLTLKGAYLLAWRSLPPLKQIRAAAIRREAARKLAEWGVTV